MENSILDWRYHIRRETALHFWLFISSWRKKKLLHWLTCILEREVGLFSWSEQHIWWLVAFGRLFHPVQGHEALGSTQLGCILERLLLHHRTTQRQAREMSWRTHTRGWFKMTSQPNMHDFEVWEEADAGTWRTWKYPSGRDQPRFELENFLLWGDRSNHQSTVLQSIPSMQNFHLTIQTSQSSKGIQETSSVHKAINCLVLHTQADHQ